ncbi:hypothetical protein HXX76_009616 [Chlamydomonas incerta]|uniref:RRM domain-containing protein n=1 Tax=Chlamydomonas incerta TaxID=51695 RepID=A0A835VZ02_CHLIN|nr:hypothetical protein HXX76_009616 [Chlamydomonas incerta]|eukprot:KAG2431083.1 hypothetical protein HXX76_009616 [Chlamydomonas incerta]
MAEETANEHGFVETAADGEPAVPKSSVLRLRGLPFSAGEDDVRQFFTDFDVATVVIGKRAGRSTGEGYVQLDSVAAAADAIAKLHRQTLGHRYIEVFESTEADLATAKSLSVDRMRGFVIRCRGLPYTSTAQDVLNFFGPDVPIVRGIEGVVFTYAPDGRPTGEAFVELQTEEAQREALKKHKESLGARYIELFVSTKVDMIQAIQQNRMILGYSNRKRWLQQQGVHVGPGGGPNGPHGGGHMPGPHGGGGHYGGGGGYGGPRGGGGRHHQQQHYGGMDEVTDMMSGFNMGGHVQMFGPGGQMLPPGTYQLEVTRDGKQRFGGGGGGYGGGGRGGRGGPGGPYGGGRGGGMMTGGGRGMGQQGYNSRPPPPGGAAPMPPMPPAARQTAQVVPVAGGGSGNGAGSSSAGGEGQGQQQQQQQQQAGQQQQHQQQHQQHQQQQYVPYEQQQQQQWAQMVPPPPGGGGGQPAPGLYGSAGGAQQAAPGIQGVVPGAYALAAGVMQVPAGGGGGYPDYQVQQVHSLQGLDGGAATAGLQSAWGPR